MNIRKKHCSLTEVRQGVNAGNKRAHCYSYDGSLCDMGIRAYGERIANRKYHCGDMAWSLGRRLMTVC